MTNHASGDRNIAALKESAPPPPEVKSSLGSPSHSYSNSLFHLHTFTSISISVCPARKTSDCPKAAPSDSAEARRHTRQHPYRRPSGIKPANAAGLFVRAPSPPK